MSTHIESDILEEEVGCLGGKSFLDLHHQIQPSLPVSPHQMNHLQETKLVFYC